MSRISTFCRSLVISFVFLFSLGSVSLVSAEMGAKPTAAPGVRSSAPLAAVPAPYQPFHAQPMPGGKPWQSPQTGRETIGDFAPAKSAYMTWNTFLGGNGAVDTAMGITTDDGGNIYIVGYSDLPWGTPIQPFSGSVDAFVAKLDPSGELIWLTFLGGSGQDYGYGVAVDGTGNIYVIGESHATWSSPIRAYSGFDDAFVAKLDSSGTLVWNTFLGAYGTDYGSGIVVDETGDLYVTGTSYDTWGTPVNPFSSGWMDAFVAKLDPDGGITWNTFLGGTGFSKGIGIAVDVSENVYIAGESNSTWGSPVRAYTGGYDAYAVKLNPSGDLAWNTYLGGGSGDYGYSIAVNGTEEVFVAGESESDWGDPVRAYTAGSDTFVVNLDSAGGLIWNTFLGGSGDDLGYGIIVDGGDNVFVTGWSDSPWGYPVQAYSANRDAFIAGLNSSGGVAWNTFLGANGFDVGTGIVMDANGNLFISGAGDASWGNPVRAYWWEGDAFAAKVDFSGHTDRDPYIKASPAADWVHARDWPADAELTLYVDQASDGLGDVDYTDYATAVQSPWNPNDPDDTNAVFDLSGVGFDIVNGDVLMVTDGTTSREYTVVDLTQLRWFIGLGTGADAMQVVAEQEVADNFNISHPGLELILEVHDYGSAQADLAAEIAADNGPDIVGPTGWRTADYFHGEWMDLAPLIASMPFNTGVFNPELVNMYQTDEGQVGLPFVVYPSAIFYNPALFTAAGLNPPPAHYGDQYEMPDHTMVDWNWDTVAQVAKLLTIDSNGYNATEMGFDKNLIVQYGYTWQYENHPNYWGSFWDDGSMFGGGSPGSYTAQVPDPWRAAWEWTYEGIWGDQPWMANAGVEGSPAYKWGNPFNSGRVAMTDQPLWYTCCMWDLAEFQFGAMPAYDGEVNGRIDADTFRIWKDTPNAEEAFEALAYLVTEGVDKLIVGSADMSAAYATYDALPALTSAQADWRIRMEASFSFVTDESWDVVMAGLDYADTPNAEGWMPNFDNAWNRGNDFGWQLRSNGEINLDNEIACYLSDLERIFNGQPTMGCAYFQARPNVDQVEAFQWPLGSTVHLEIDDPATPASPDYSGDQTVGTAPWDANQTYASFDLAGVLDIQSGFIATVSGSGITKVLLVTNHAFTGIDVDTDIVTGVSVPGARVDVWVCGPVDCPANRHVYANGSGAWTADFSVVGVEGDEQTTYDIVPGTWVDSSQHDADGDSTMWGETVPNPRIDASPNGRWITAREWPIDTLLTLEIDDPGTPDPIDYSDDAIVEHNPGNPGDPNDIGAFFDWPEALGLQVNFVLTVTGGGTTKVLIISPLNVTSANPATDTVSGVGLAGGQVQVCANIPGRCITRWVTANGGGNWTADYSVAGVPPDDADTVDLVPGNNGWVADSDGDGDQTWIDWTVYSLSVADPYIKADPVENWVHAHDWPAGNTITLLIDDASNGLGGVDYSDSAVVAQSPWNPADPNDTHVVFDLDGVFDLDNGDIITVTDGTTSRDYTVVDLTQIRWFIGLGTGADPSQIIVEQEVADNFNVSHSGLELFLEVHDSGSAQADLAAEIAADNGPDIVGSTGWSDASYFHGDWMDLAPLIASAGFDTGVFDTNLVAMYQTDEGQVGLPFVTHPSAIFYNPVLFDAAGLNYPPAAYGLQYEMPDHTLVEWNWETVSQVAKLLTIDSSGYNATENGFDKNSIVQYGYTWQYQNHPNNYGSFWGGGSMFAGGSPGSYTAQVPDPWRAAWEWTYEGIWGDQPWMANAGVEASPEYQWGNPFDSGRVAMTDQPMWYTCCTWDLTEFQFGAMPTYNGDVGGRIDADTFQIWNGTPHAEQAFEALEYLVTEGVDKLIVGSVDMPAAYGAYGALPALMSAQTAWRDAKELQFPFITDASWDVMMAGLDYADIPNAGSWTPNFDNAWNRGNGFLDLLRNNPGVNLDYAVECYRADLQAIFNGEPLPGCLPLPGAFGKSAPGDGGIASVTPTLAWAASSDAEEYEYCYDTTDDDSCDGPWTSAGTDVSVALSGLTSSMTYYWQVRAFNAAGEVYADGSTWWSFTALPPLPGAFGKEAPADTAATTTSPTLSWGVSGDSTSYEYCYDTTNNDACDGSWTSTGTSTSIGLFGLSNSTTYYWQVRAVNTAGSTEADGGTWWSFTTLPPLPGAFGKIGPADAAATTASPTLSWGASSDADEYEYCYDATNDSACDGPWVSAGASTSIGLSGLTNTATYYWQVRAVNAAGNTEADAGTWWSFTVKVQTFADVPVTYWAWSYIERLFAAGITGGCASSPLRYCPTGTVTRAQMAIFLERGMNGSAYTPPAATGTVFGDVPISYWAAAWIEKLYADGITGGCGGGNFCPDQAVTRAQMAIFLLRAEHGSGYTPPAATGTVFGDVPISHWAGAWIEQLSAEGITGGCGGGNYCPNQAVTRAEMAIFLVRTFSLP